MNKDIFINGVLITLVFAILYYLESRFVSKREINLKEIVKYSLIVYISYLVSTQLYAQIEVKNIKKVTQVFTETPNF
jgi:hypothetical protein